MERAVGECAVLFETQVPPRRAGQGERDSLAEQDRELEEFQLVDRPERQEDVQCAPPAEQERIPCQIGCPQLAEQRFGRWSPTMTSAGTVSGSGREVRTYTCRPGHGQLPDRSPASRATRPITTAWQSLLNSGHSYDPWGTNPGITRKAGRPSGVAIYPSMLAPMRVRMSMPGSSRCRWRPLCGRLSRG